MYGLGSDRYGVGRVTLLARVQEHLEISGGRALSMAEITRPRIGLIMAGTHAGTVHVYI